MPTSRNCSVAIKRGLSNMPLEQIQDMSEAVEQWLSSEGYPLEYYVAGRFAFSRFHVLQGEHVRIRDEEKPREVDVVADMATESGGMFIRASNVVECKWSADKPWVIFTSGRGRMMNSAVVAQTMGSAVGDTLLWMLCGDKSIQRLALFQSPKAPGFGGRQAFANKNDLFYATMASVTSACVGMNEDADRGQKFGNKKLPRYAHVSFPLVVIEGHLFEASYNAEGGRIETKEVETVRCHWRGSPSWPLHATVDFVTREALPRFVERRAADFLILLPALAQAALRLEAAYNASDLSLLGLKRGATGRGGWPKLFRHILSKSANKEVSK